MRLQHYLRLSSNLPQPFHYTLVRNMKLLERFEPLWLVVVSRDNSAAL